MKHNRIILFLLFTSMHGMGCSTDSDFSTIPPSSQEIDLSNQLRKTNGIREISKEWTYLYRDNGRDSWKDAKGRVCKIVEHDNSGKIICETDRYYSGKQFVFGANEDMSIVDEVLEVIHMLKFEKKRIFVSYFGSSSSVESLLQREMEFARFDPQNLSGKADGTSAYQGKDDTLTLKCADEILRLWSLRRLD